MSEFNARSYRKRSDFSVTFKGTRKKRAKFTRNKRVGHRLDTVGVAGSIPVEPTISNLDNPSQVIEIPNGYSVIPALDYRQGRFRLYRIIIKNRSKRSEKGVTFSKGKKRA